MAVVAHDLVGGTGVEHGHALDLGGQPVQPFGDPGGPLSAGTFYLLSPID